VFDPRALLTRQFTGEREDYGPDKTILHALAVGVGLAEEAEAVDFLYEAGLKTLPTLALVLGGDAGMWFKRPSSGIDPSRVLHLAQKIVTHDVLPPSGSVIATNRVDSVHDRGAKGAVLIQSRSVCDAITGGAYATVTSTLLLRGQGGFGGSAPPPRTRFPWPERRCDDELICATTPQQAALYRLLGDRNSLHIDPGAARLAGFDRPILHGMCTFGIAAYGLCRLVEVPPSRLLDLEAEFSAAVFPGEALLVRAWHEDQAVRFRVIAQERDIVVMDNGRARFSPAVTDETASDFAAPGCAR